MKFLLYAVIIINVLLVAIPWFLIKQKSRSIKISLVYFIALGMGFMMIEVSMFQKLILYLGSPTISLVILLSSLLVSMGIGSYAGNRIYATNHQKRIQTVALLVIGGATLFFYLSQYNLNACLQYDLLYRAIVTIVLIFPFGFLLGILFPSCIQLLKKVELTQCIPWMYGINGTMSVLGSILAVVLTMLLGFTPAFFIGLFWYLIIFVFTFQTITK